MHSIVGGVTYFEDGAQVFARSSAFSAGGARPIAGVANVSACGATVFASETPSSAGGACSIAGETTHFVGETSHCAGDTFHITGDTTHFVGETFHIAGDTTYFAGDTFHFAGVKSHFAGEILLFAGAEKPGHADQPRRGRNYRPRRFRRRDVQPLPSPVDAKGDGDRPLAAFGTGCRIAPIERRAKCHSERGTGLRHVRLESTCRRPVPQIHCLPL
ncbi:MAG: hypothetical protein QM770_20340 [Tepidisphaeraceae bacterium]